MVAVESSDPTHGIVGRESSPRQRVEQIYGDLLSAEIESPLGRVNIEDLHSTLNINKEDVTDVRTNIDNYFSRFGIRDYSGYLRSYLNLPDNEGTLIVNGVQIATPNFRDMASNVTTRILNRIIGNVDFAVMSFSGDSVGNLDVKKGGYRPEFYTGTNNPGKDISLSSNKSRERTPSLGDLETTYPNIAEVVIDRGFMHGVEGSAQNITNMKDAKMHLTAAHELMRWSVYGSETPGRHDVTNFFAQCAKDVVVFGPDNVDDIDINAETVFVWKNNRAEGSKSNNQELVTIGELRRRIKEAGYNLNDESAFNYFDADNGGYNIRPSSTMYYGNIPVYTAMFSVPNENGSIPALMETLEDSDKFIELSDKSCQKLKEVTGRMPNFYIVEPYISPNAEGKGLRSTAYVQQFIDNPDLLGMIEEHVLANFEPTGKTVYQLHLEVTQAMIDYMNANQN